MIARLAMVCAVFSAACFALSAADRAQIARDALAIDGCQEKARGCKADASDASVCWPVYDACMREAGLR